MHARLMELHSLGRYRLVSPFSTQSAACRFYLARHEDDSDDREARFVVKLFTPQAGDAGAAARGRFEHEVRLLRALNHACIPTLRAAGEQDGVAYAVMDRVHGVDLATLLGHTEGRPRPLSKQVAVYVMGQLADAVNHVHTLEVLGDDDEPEPLGAVHRDICPANIFLSRDGDVMLGDFGSATSGWLNPELHVNGVGHRAYMAPERVAGTVDATESTDVFAMAVVLWEMLRGERCFWAEDDKSTMDAIMRFDISHPGRRVPGLSPKLSEIVRKNLDRDPARRYVSAYQVLQRLAQAPEAKAAEAARGELATMVTHATRLRG